MGRWLVALALAGGGCDGGGGGDPTDAPTDAAATDAPDTGTSSPGCFTLADGRCVEETFRSPPVVTPDADGVVRLDLAASEITLDGERHCARLYNGVYPGPTIDTPARVGGEPRVLRVDLANRLAGHDYQDLAGRDCTCVDAQGQECLPEHVHDRCAPETDACTCTSAGGEACHMFDFNVTNLHAHGSHVRPDYARGGEACEVAAHDGVAYACRECGDDVCDGDAADDACFHGDDVISVLHPGTGKQYRWDLDEDGTHHAGLQWYHPHIHGTTSIQVASGAAGAWIVRGEVDALDGLRDARERVVVFSTPAIGGQSGFRPLADGEACTDETLTMNDFHTLSATFNTQVNLINDARKPRMITPPGQVERWRILHAGFLDEVFLGMFRGGDADCSTFSTAEEDTLELRQIGRDGILLPSMYAGPYVFLSPGYRVEAVFGGDQELRDGETWCLVAARFLQAGGDGPGGGQPYAPDDPPTLSDIFTRFDQDGDVVATLNVTASAGAATTTALPDFAAVAALAPPVDVGGRDIDQRCAEAAAQTDPARLDQAAVLQVGVFTADEPDPCDCPNHNVNCKNFETTDRSVYPFDRDLPLGEVEHWRIGASFDGHPFHLHVNPFVVCPQENVFDPLPFAHWRDTYLVNTGRKVDLITEYRAFTGPYVFHCHKLTHEDEGMMQLLRVCDPATDPTCGDGHWRGCAPGDLQCVQALAATDCWLEGDGIGAAACVAALGTPLGVCGPNACGTDDDCALSDRCDANVCLPAPCPTPCGPRQTCEHGVCR